MGLPEAIVYSCMYGAVEHLRNWSLLMDLPFHFADAWGHHYVDDIKIIVLAMFLNKLIKTTSSHPSDYVQGHHRQHGVGHGVGHCVPRVDYANERPTAKNATRGECRTKRKFKIC